MILQVYMQYWMASAIFVAADLGIADVLDRTPRDVDDIARAVGADAGCLFRLLRGLASAGVFREERPRQFVNTPLSDGLRSKSPTNARALIRVFGLKSTREAMAEYETVIKTGTSAFEIVHGTPSPFDVVATRPQEAAIYNEAMAVDDAMVAAIIERYDFADRKKLVDVGGGTGAFIARVLQKNPEQRGVLFDLPSVVTDAVLVACGVRARCDVQSGDMRKEVPLGGDAYVLKHILHGWPDEECVALLRRIRNGCAPGAHVFIIENVMPEGNGAAPCKVFDLFLLLGGAQSRVRSQADFQALFRRSGFTLSRLVPIVQDHCIIEATPSE